jgi:very-short-patch-repair endonuclease
VRYEYNGKSHKYYPDFYIPNYNLIVEIKSSWILKKQGRTKNQAKKEFTESQGFNFIMIIDNDFFCFQHFINLVLNNK